MDAPRAGGSIAIGIVRAAHGLDGSLKVESHSGEQDHFDTLSEVEFRKDGTSSAYRIAEIRHAGKFVLLRLEGCETVESARRLVGAQIFVPRDLASPVRDGEYYYADLVGCDLVFEDRVVGSVRSVIELPHCDVLEVDTGSGSPIMVPFQDVFVGTVDTALRKVELKAGWLLE